MTDLSRDDDFEMAEAICEPEPVTNKDIVMNMDKEVVPLMICLPYNWNRLIDCISTPSGFMTFMSCSLSYYSYLWYRVRSAKKAELVSSYTDHTRTQYAKFVNDIDSGNICVWTTEHINTILKSLADEGRTSEREEIHREIVKVHNEEAKATQ